MLLVDLHEQALAHACAQIGGNQVSYLVGDVTAADDNARMVETVADRYGGVDIFLANAGIEGDVASLLDYDEPLRSCNGRKCKRPLSGRACSSASRAGARWRQHYHHLQCYRRPRSASHGTLCHQQTCGDWFNALGGARVCEGGHSG